MWASCVAILLDYYSLCFARRWIIKVSITLLLYDYGKNRVSDFIFITLCIYLCVCLFVYCNCLFGPRHQEMHLRTIFVVLR